jgi:hypothetical protein
MCHSDMGNLSRCWLFCLGGVPCVLQTWVTSADRMCTMCHSDMGNLSRCWLFCLGGVSCVFQTWVTLADVSYSV